MYNNDAQRCLTGEVRLSYVSLDKPRQPQGGVGLSLIHISEPTRPY